MPILVSEEHPQKLLVLIIDKAGIFGSSLAASIHKDITTVLVSKKEEQPTAHLLPVPYTSAVPEIPEGEYTHIIFVWDGEKESLHILPPLLEKASIEKAHMLFVADYHLYKPEIQTLIDKYYFHTSVLLVGDVFGNEQYTSIITTFFQHARKGHHIALEEVGLKTVYPILYEDALTEILRIGFGNEKGKVFLAMQQYGTTELSVAHAIQKIDPLVQIDFQKKDLPQVALPNGTFLLGKEYPLLKKIQESYRAFLKGKEEKHETLPNLISFSPITLQKKQKKQKKKVFLWLGILLILLAVLFSPVLCTLMYALSGASLLYGARTALTAGNLKQAAVFSQTGENMFGLAGQTNIVAEKELSLIFLSPAATMLSEQIHNGSVLSQVGSKGIEAAGYFSDVAKGKSLSPSGDFLLGVNALEEALTTLTSAKTTLSFDGISQATLSSLLSPWTGVLDVSPDLFGFPEKKTYLVLFQNNMELRPGGGFIGSYALVTLDKGRVTNFTIHNVYDADGQLKGHVEPPWVLRRYVQVHWYLRDSNFDVDFAQDAANAAFFLKQETGVRVDGVVGVDLSFVKDVLETIGPVYVPSYKETVTAQNLFLLTETHAEKDSFAGSTQKQDFLKALFEAIQTKLTKSHTFSAKGAVSILSAVQQKDVVFGFSNPLVQDVFTVNGLSSTLWDGRKEGDNTILDFTGLNEANLGVNKANYFVTRTVTQNMAISDVGSVSGQLKIQYKNTSQKNKWPGGPYKNYLRVILPEGAVLTHIAINGQNQTIVPAVTDPKIYEAANFIAPKGLEVDKTTESGKTLYGFFVIIPEESEQTVVVGYTLLNTFDMTKPTLVYNGLLFKQPGIGDYPYTFTLTYPKNLTVLQKPSFMKTEGTTLYFTNDFTMDTPFTISLTNNL